MHFLIFTTLFVIIQSPLSEVRATDHCRDDDDRLQSQNLAEAYLRRYLDSDEIRQKLIPSAIPLSSSFNKNSNLNLGSASQPMNLGAYSDWWEVVTERTPDGGKHTYLRLDPVPRATSYDTIKSRLVHDQIGRIAFDDGTRREMTSNSESSTKGEEDETNSENRKSAPAPYGYGYGAARRSKVSPSSDKPKSNKIQNVLKNRKNDENLDLQNELRRKSSENVNSNTNVNARRNSNLDGTKRSETRKSSNSNKNVNVNDRGFDDGLLDIYQKYGRGPAESDVGPKAMSPRPIAERSHSNVNHNVNANLNGDVALGAGLLRSEDLRRALNNKKKLFPRLHHPNDNHNVNININGEEPVDDQPEEPEADQPPAGGDNPAT